MSAADATRLWQSGDPSTWEAALDNYPAVIEAQGVADLEPLDRWYREELPGIVAAREPPCLEPDEVADVVRWKMKRGEWRPRNLALVRANDPALVRQKSIDAFSLAPDVRRAITRMSELGGIGPATASALLAVYRGDVFPFLDDLVGQAIEELGEPRFALPYYLRYAEALRQRATALGRPWTAQRVGLALWSASGGKAALQRNR